jgi:hypothetical protein
MAGGPGRGGLLEGLAVVPIARCTSGETLCREFNARSEPEIALSRWLEGQGVDVSHAWNVAGPILEHNITIFPRMMFDFAEPGRPDSVRAVVHVAYDDDAETPVDLVAWTREKPHQVYRCLGSACAIGIDRLFNPASYFAGRPLRVRRSPLDWLAAGCDGIVPLDYSAIRNRISWSLRDFDEYRLAADSLAQGRALRDALAPLPARVRILVPRAEAA